MRRLVLAAAIVSAALIQGCSWAPSFGVYKLEIVQGNYVTQEMVERLKVGMTRAQVRTALGTPLLTDPFHADRWDYVYERYRRGGRIERHDFRVHFENDRLAKWEGEGLPQSPLAAARSADSLPGIRTDPAANEPGWWDKILETFKW